MNRVLVAGFGSELRGDDAAGLLAARALRELDVAGVDVEEHHDAVSLAFSISRHAEVVLVDAVSSGGQAGAVVDVAPQDEALRGDTSSHGLGLGHAVELARALGASPKLTVIGITGHEFSPGASPSPEVVRAAAEVAVRIKETLLCA
jgi:hydrogenase maturation protease